MCKPAITYLETSAKTWKCNFYRESVEMDFKSLFLDFNIDQSNDRCQTTATKRITHTTEETRVDFVA